MPMETETEKRERRERMLPPLKIKTRDVPKEKAAKWFGMPPTEAKSYLPPVRSGSISF